MRLLTALVAATLALPAAAQDSVPQGIGFAEAQGRLWLCRHEDANEALACAREHCLEEAPDAECRQVAWCDPAGWSGVMTVELAGGAAPRVLCGMADEAALSRMLETLCGLTADAKGCALTLTVDPDGNERPIEGVTFLGGATVPEPVPDTAPGPLPEPMLEDSTSADPAVPEAAPEIAPAVPEATPEPAVPEATPEATPQATPEVAPQAQPEAAPSDAPEPSPSPQDPQ